MSVVAMECSHLALDTNCAAYASLSSREGCAGVLGLFDDAERTRAPRFAPLRSLGRKDLENASVLQAASTKNINHTAGLILRLAHRKTNELPINSVL